ncbi:MAG: CHAT domain-containing protein, partial [Moorea sp. SIO2B7]|nr:CHAT domain-containing protein [Moorena sp. SIO2B7]
NTFFSCLISPVVSPARLRPIKLSDRTRDGFSIKREIGNRAGEAITLNNIGRVYDDLGEKQRALEYLQQALPLNRAVGDRTGEATTLNNIGRVYDNLGEKQKALEYLQKALPISQAVGDRATEAIILAGFGKVYSDLGKKEQALDYYQQSLPLLQAVGDRRIEAKTLYRIASLEKSRGNLLDALSPMQKSIAIIEDLRTKVASPELRRSYFATVQDEYQLYIDLLMDLHQENPNQDYDKQAFQISESSRARTLVEQLTEAQVDLKKGVSPELLTEEKQLFQALNIAEQQRLDLLNKPGGFSENKLEIIKTEIKKISHDLQTVEGKIRNESPAYANLKFPKPLSLEEVQAQILDDNTILLEYYLGEKRSFLFVVSKNDFKTYELPDIATVEGAVEEYLKKLKNPSFTEISEGKALSEILLGQIETQLQGKRLLIVANGKLQLLPFVALPFSEGEEIKPLMADNDIIPLPSATSLAVQREQWQKLDRAPKTVAVIADPVFKADDSRLGENAIQISNSGDLSKEESLLRNSCQDFERLPETAKEAQEILALVSDSQKFSAMGFDANYDTATNTQLKEYQILHFATHGCIQDNPRLSNLALSFYKPDGQKSENSLLKLQDIYNLDLNAELVVLSACQTGTGEDVKGEGIVGLTSGFMYAGARRVVVSLWSVNDTSTSELMGDYYRQMLEQNTNPIAALHQAQLKMWNTEQWRSPYYWAAFTIQGDF